MNEQENETVILTKHSIKRMKERLGIPKKATQFTAQKAFNLGINHQSAKGNLNKWLNKVFMSYRNASNMRIFGNHVYLFAGLTLITVYHLPNSLKKAVRSLEVDNLNQTK